MVKVSNKKLPGTVKELEKKMKARRVSSSDSSSDSSDSEGGIPVKPRKIGSGKPPNDIVVNLPVREPKEVPSEDKIRNELIRLSEDGELDKTVAYLKKASKKVIMKIHDEVKKKRVDKANEFLTDLLISKFSGVLGGIDAIESTEELTKELKRDPLLRADVIKAVSYITPYIPLLGILSGGVTCAKHVVAHKTNTMRFPNLPENPKVWPTGKLTGPLLVDETEIRQLSEDDAEEQSHE